ncbi:protein MpTRIHELIX26 [Marchantia polymorpha subsp. ruderalis]|uniref:Myb/SANT-like DNA-binding domain-containing protein n=2 Tax=Marchantia polymorpha TaxID=3197 RepID=A0AAF6AKZ1_MARPO|nr:hypothetical protein MARPO_0113s0058 [Marchantia polymorpha]BBM97111.1 hypothetical protein Mp_1g03100 [Marchantia polymorpha subsp. ruderalis]|eukprot:PTQ31334.1 hypothetical protein MARPO_0113s0058 [Marchantia polymorpha]
MMASGLAGAGIGVGVGVVGSGEGLRFRDLVTGETGAGGAKGAAEWTDVAVATFLDCFAEKYAAVKHKNLRGKDWKEVVDNLNKRCVPEGGPFFEYKQCRNKLDGLKKRFRQEKESLNANSQPSKWQWFSRMCELKGKRAPRVNSSAGVGAGVGVVGGIAPIGGVGGIVPGIVVPLEKSELDLTEGADNTSDSKEQPDGTDGLPGGLPGDLPDGVGTPFCSQNEADTASPRSKPRAGVGKKTRKRRRSHLHTPCAPELMPVGPNKQPFLWPGDAAQRRPVATDRTYKLKIKRSGEEDFDDLFHLTGDTVQDLIDSFKSVYWEEENTQVRVQLKDKVSDAWVTVAPSVSLSQYGIEAQIIIKPQGSRVLGYPAIPLTVGQMVLPGV